MAHLVLGEGDGVAQMVGMPANLPAASQMAEQSTFPAFGSFRHPLARDS
ncbi:hypothetical protein ACETRX_22685 [Labrys portucalensis]|uniref:Uncharacterized protein n=1 Tax=Labrys neptuniae TaxID=376174 RepID=A0ABV6ZJU5_9HYPH